MIKCPFCDAAIDAEEDELEEGDEIMCEECGADIEVVSTDPLELDGVEGEEEEEEEDEDSDGDEDEDGEDENEEEDEDWR